MNTFKLIKMSEEKTEGKPEVQFNDKEEDDPETVYRIYSVLAYIIVLVFVGIPVWWFTTRVYRAPLPLDDMYNVKLPNKTDKPYGIPLSIEYDVLITIVNPSPETLNVDLDGEILDVNLQPFLDKLSPVADFIVKTQWLYLMELGVVPKKLDDHYALYEDQLPHIITPLEKKLWSYMSPRPCLNLVLYITNCKAPIIIYDKENQRVQTNMFLSPRWGGILILNPNAASCENRLYKPDVGYVISAFIMQLENLFRLKSTVDEDLVKFQRRKAVEFLDSTRRTLKSLAQLLSEISSIVISDDVADTVKVALKNAGEGESLLEQDDVMGALSVAKVSFKNSEAAFSDPSLLALLYFPDDQKYAVYIPLFLPVMIPVFMSITTVRRWYIKYKESKVKAD